MSGPLHYPTYESLGVRPLVNAKGTYTIISGSLVLPEVRQAMSGIEPRSLWVSPGDAHPNARAHQLIAKELFAHLTADLLEDSDDETASDGAHQE